MGIVRNPTFLRTVFPLQSFLDDTQLNEALQAQDSNSPIIPSTLQTAQVVGTVVGLHPDSQTPVTVRVTAGAKISGFNYFTLTPGQVMRVVDGGFGKLEWGLPHGWLGGGAASLVIANNEDALVDFAEERQEVLFHRQRMKIVADANPSSSPGAYLANWPIRFPWVAAGRYNSANFAQPFDQSGKPLLAVTPTRVVMRLRVSNLASPTNMRILVRGVDDYDLGSDGKTISYTDLTSVVDVQWPAQLGAPSVSTPYPVIELADVALRVGGDSAVVTVTDGGNAALTNQYVDVFRYGKI